MPEADLTDRARAGDLDAFTALIGRYDRALRALAYRLLGDRDLMDDALQEAYLKAFRGLPEFTGGSSFGTWLYRIAYNACLDELRRGRAARHLPLEEAAAQPDPGPDPADVATGGQAVAAALASLPADLRAAVLLVDAEGMDYDAAGRVLGIPPGTVGSRLSRARASLRKALAPDEPSEGIEGSEGSEGSEDP